MRHHSGSTRNQTFFVDMDSAQYLEEVLCWCRKCNLYLDLSSLHPEIQNLGSRIQVCCGWWCRNENSSYGDAVDGGAEYHDDITRNTLCSVFGCRKHVGFEVQLRFCGVRELWILHKPRRLKSRQTLLTRGQRLGRCEVWLVKRKLKKLRRLRVPSMSCVACGCLSCRCRLIWMITCEFFSHAKAQRRKERNE